jgi:hypothetical protein
MGPLQITQFLSFIGRTQRVGKFLVLDRSRSILVCREHDKPFLLAGGSTINVSLPPTPASLE